MAPTARLRRDLSTTVMSSRVRRCSWFLCRQKPLLEAVKVKTPMTATKLMKMRMNVPPRVLGKVQFRELGKGAGDGLDGWARA
jgi:hypothetical protein